MTSPPVDGGIREQRKQQTRARILDAAKTRFAALGVRGTTVEDLARTAGVSRATFFNYFAGKDAVLDALWADQLARSTSVVTDGLARPTSTRRRLQELFADLAEATDRHPGYLRVVTVELERDLADAPLSAARTARFQELLLRLLQAGIEAGDVRADHPPELLAELVGALYVSVLRSWRQEPDYDLPRRSAAAAALLADALSPVSSASSAG